MSEFVQNPEIVLVFQWNVKMPIVQIAWHTQSWVFHDKSKSVHSDFNSRATKKRFPYVPLTFCTLVNSWLRMLVLALGECEANKFANLTSSFQHGPKRIWTNSSHCTLSDWAILIAQSKCGRLLYWKTLIRASMCKSYACPFSRVPQEVGASCIGLAQIKTLSWRKNYCTLE